MQLSYGSTKTEVRIQESGVRRKPNAESRRPGGAGRLNDKGLVSLVTSCRFVSFRGWLFSLG